MAITFDEAIVLLKAAHRSELVDKYFGDREVYFATPEGQDIAEGYEGSTGISVTIQGTEFTGEHAYTLIRLGKLVHTERNDSMVDDEEE